MHDYRTNTRGVPARYVLELLNFMPGVYILENIPPPGREISADVIWGKKYEKGKRKGKKEKGRKGKKKRKGEVKG